MSLQIKGVHFEHPIMVGGGIFKTAEQMATVVKTEVVPEWGSIETEPSNGNGGKDYHAEFDASGKLLFTQNSKGIPNPGMTYVEEHAPELLKLYANHNKPLVLNISGKNLEDTLSLMKRALRCGVRVVVVNGACPNKKDQPILCQDVNAVTELFRRADEEIGQTHVVFVWKVSNGMPRPTLMHNCAAVARSRTFSGIVTGNTVPNTLCYDAEGRTTILTERGGIDRGGMGGTAIHPIALDHTSFCAANLPRDKIVIGCGGASDVRTVGNFFRAGAGLVQIVSAFMVAGERPEFIRDLLIELA